MKPGAMKTTLLRKLSYSVIVAMPILAATNSPACGNNTSTISSLPPIDVGGYQVYALNPGGELTGFFNNSTHSAHAFTYNAGALTDLGTLGGATSIGYAMNSAGQVAGRADLVGGTHAFLYSSGSLGDLGTLGGSYSSAAAINDAGQVVGESDTAGNAGPVAFLYANGSMVSLGTLGSNYSTAYAINKSGTVVGQSGVPSSDLHGFVYSGGVLTDVGTLGGTYSSAFALNDAGLIVGESYVASGDTHAFTSVGGVMTDLGTLGGTYSTAFVVNSNSQVAGVANTLNDQETHGFLYDHGTMTDLGTLGGTYSSVWTLNNRGQIVGQSALVDGTTHAFLWENGAMVDLNTRLPANSGWELVSAQLINDSGRIVGYGNYAGTANQWFVMDLATGNNPPVAVAGPDQTVDCQAQVTLNGSGSSDPDNDPLTFEWSLGGSVLGTTAILTRSLPMGTNVVSLKVTDSCGASAQATLVVAVIDTMPPTGSCPTDMTASSDANCSAPVPDVVSLVVANDNCTPSAALKITQDPVAGTMVGLGPHPISIKVTDSSGNSSTCGLTFTVQDTTAPAIVSVPAPLTVSADANCQGVVPNVLLNVVATDNCTPADQLLLSQIPPAGTVLPSGQYLISVTATDMAGNSNSANVGLTITNDNPPVVQCVTATPNILNPPNHQVVPVTIAVFATGNCNGALVSKIVSVASNEPVSAGDIQITGDLTLNLAASRNPSGGGRVYTITVQSTDASGNASTATVSVVVPKGNGNGNTIGTSIAKKKI
jgi:probable HAF family extracellular repeat protein